MAGADGSTDPNGPNEASRAEGEDAPLAVVTYTDGGQTGETIARRLAAFVSGARASLDIAVYDFALSPPLMGIV